MNSIEAIQKSSLFKDISTETINEIVSCCHQKSYSKGQELFGMEDQADSFFVIIKGWVKLYRVSREGEEVVIHVFGPGESFAEAAVFGDQRSYPANAHAATDVTLVEIPRSFFIRKIEQDSRFALRILASIFCHQHYLIGQIEQITVRTASQRMGVFLLNFCHSTNTEDGALIIDLPYDKSLISTRLNIKPETFSRAISKLKPYGVTSNKNRILIQDPKKLADFCDL